MADILTVFYSLKGETIAPGMKIVNLEKGHTAVARNSSRRPWAVTFSSLKPSKLMWKTT